MVEYDLIILGAGTSGLPTSRLAAGKGKKVLLIGDRPIGGKCINYGCTPTKALVYATKLFREAQKAKNYGVKTGEVSISFNKAMAYTKNLVKNAVKQNEERLAKFENIQFIENRGKFVNESDVEIRGETYDSKAILIATGARDFIPPIKGLDNITYLTNKNIWKLENLPQSIGFVGGGFISCEFASIFNAFGSEVHIFERNPKVIARADALISETLNQYFIEDGIKIHANSVINEIKIEGGNILVDLGELGNIEVEELMVATRFQGNTGSLNAEVAKLEIDRRGYVVVNNFLETSNSKVWAIGDVVGKQQFTHMALNESKAVVQNMFGNSKVAVRFEDIPYAVFTDPPIGSVGKTEYELKQKEVSYEVAHTELPRCSRGVIMQLKRGHVKILHNNNEIFGAHIIGEDSDNLIHELVPLIGLPNGWEIFNQTIHAHPTLSEIFYNLQK